MDSIKYFRNSTDLWDDKGRWMSCWIRIVIKQPTHLMWLTWCGSRECLIGWWIDISLADFARFRISSRINELWIIWIFFTWITVKCQLISVQLHYQITFNILETPKWNLQYDLRVFILKTFLWFIVLLLPPIMHVCASYFLQRKVSSVSLIVLNILWWIMMETVESRITQKQAVKLNLCTLCILGRKIFFFRGTENVSWVYLRIENICGMFSFKVFVDLGVKNCWIFKISTNWNNNGYV